VAFSRGLPDPWPTALALVAPLISVLWGLVQAEAFERLDDWKSKREAEREASTDRREIDELKTGVAAAKAEIETMEPGAARARMEQELRELSDAIPALRIISLQQKLGEATSTRVPKGPSRASRSK
jgi:hypothetical protein